MKSLRILFVPAVVFLSACGSPESDTGSDASATDSVQAAGPNEITDIAGLASYYECPMKCDNKKFDGPGNCPVCHMPLVEVTVASSDSLSAEGDGHTHEDGAMDHDDESHEGHMHE